jgi:hypothetical protein
LVVRFDVIIRAVTEVQYISDANGKPVGVIVPIDVWNELESGTLKEQVNDLKRLFKKTQDLQSVKATSDEDVASEIDDYRNGK